MIMRIKTINHIVTGGTIGSGVSETGEVSDRTRIEQSCGIETRVDLLSGMHVKKAILTAYLHEVHYRKMPLPVSVGEVLKRS